MGELVSIIVPVYNAEVYLKECIDSLVRQTYTNLEIILVDDGSTDTSGHICDMYEKNYNNISVFHIKNSGVSHARNIGVSKACGEYIFFVDSDDLLETYYINNFMRKELNEIDFVGGGFLKRFEEGNDVKIEMLEGKLKLEEFKERIYKMLPVHYISVWGVRYKKSIIQQYHITFCTNLRLGEDIRFNLQYLEKVNTIYMMKNSGYIYRMVLGSQMHQYEVNRLENIRDEAQILEKFLNVGDLYYRLKYYYWHSALAHYYKYYNIADGQEKKDIKKKIRETYEDSYFRRVNLIVRKCGSLDEKMETYFMSYNGKKVYSILMRILKTIYKLKR